MMDEGGGVREVGVEMRDKGGEVRGPFTVVLL